MTPPPIDLVRSCVRALCARHHVALVTPESPSALRSAVHLTVAAVSPLTLPQVKQRASFYVPELVEEAYDLLTAAVPSPVAGFLPAVDAPVVLLSLVAWESAVILCGTGPHEVGHHLQDLRARKAVGVVGSIVHGAAYVIHETVRGDSEVTVYTHDLAAAVIVGGVDPDAHAAGLLDVLRSSYRLGDHALAHTAQTLASASASLKARQLPGVGTPLHELLRDLVTGGWDPGEWREAITGSRDTAVPA